MNRMVRGGEEPRSKTMFAYKRDRARKRFRQQENKSIFSSFQIPVKIQFSLVLPTICGVFDGCFPASETR